MLRLMYVLQHSFIIITFIKMVNNLREKNVLTTNIIFRLMQWVLKLRRIILGIVKIMIVLSL